MIPKFVWDGRGKEGLIDKMIYILGIFIFFLGDGELIEL